MTREDIEFYEAKLVMTVALQLIPKGKLWHGLSQRQRVRYLTLALDVLHSLLNDEDCLERLHRLSERKAVPVDIASP